MTEKELFSAAGMRPEEQKAPKRRQKAKKPVVSAVVLSIIILGCLFAGVLAGKDPSYMDLMNYTHAPDREFLFGTDTLGRDLFSCIWYGGRVSLFVGIFAAAISLILAVVYGALSGVAPAWIDTLMMRLTEILLSVPSLLLTIFIQAILGEPSVWSIAFVIGITSWFGMAKVVRTEVRQLRNSDYVTAAVCMGGGFFHILVRHLAPNFISSIMFMAVMNIRSAIVAESTLSFIGMGLPLDIISWGSMLSLAEKALMTKAWWIILIPGAFLVTVLMCMTNIGNWIRRSVNQAESNL